MGPLDILIVRSMPELDRHATAWNRLAAESPQHAPMLSYAWMASYFEHRLSPGESWFCVFAYDGGELVGVLPQVRSPRRSGPVPYHILRTPYDHHTISIAPLVAAHRTHEVVSQLLAGARRACPRHFRLEMQRLPEDAPIWALAESPVHRMLAVKRFRSMGAYLPVPDDFEAYRAELSRNFRSNLNKAANKLRKCADVRTRFLTGAEATEAELSHFMHVEASSWKGDEGTAIQSSPELIEFYTALTRRLSEAGWLEWHFLEGEGKILAANLAVRLGPVLLLWKLGYDASYRRLSPGSLLMERLVERAVADPALREINLMTDQPWYDNWQMKRRACYDLILYPWRPLPLLLGYGARRARQRAREVPAAERAIQKLLALRDRG